MCPLNAWNSASLLIAFPYSFASLLLLPCHHLDNTARVPRNLIPTTIMDPSSCPLSRTTTRVNVISLLLPPFKLHPFCPVAPFTKAIHTLTGHSTTQPPPLFLRNRNRDTPRARVSSILLRFSSELVLTRWRICRLRFVCWGDSEPCCATGMLY